MKLLKWTIYLGALYLVFAYVSGFLAQCLILAFIIEPIFKMYAKPSTAAGAAPAIGQQSNKS